LTEILSNSILEYMEFKKKILIVMALFVLVKMPLCAPSAASSLPPLPKELEKAIEFHGHICNGFAKGYIAAKIAQKILQAEGFEKTPILPIAENNQCGLDAIQATLKENSAFGNTIGNRARGLIVDDVGKDAFKFVRLIDMKGIRVLIKLGVVEAVFRRKDWEYAVLRRKFFLGIAREAGKDKLFRIEKDNFRKLLAMPTKELCSIRELTNEEISYIEEKYLAKLGPPDNKKLVCPICKEEFLASRSRKLGGQTVCIACARKAKNAKKKK